jgi:hypothetical protein
MRGIDGKKYARRYEGSGRTTSTDNSPGEVLPRIDYNTTVFPSVKSFEVSVRLDGKDEPAGSAADAERVKSPGLMPQARTNPEIHGPIGDFNKNIERTFRTCQQQLRITRA